MNTPSETKILLNTTLLFIAIFMTVFCSDTTAQDSILITAQHSYITCWDCHYNATTFGIIFLPPAFVAAYGYNPSLENAVLVMEIAPQATVNTIALKLSPPNMPANKNTQSMFGSNAIKIN